MVARGGPIREANQDSEAARRVRIGAKPIRTETGIAGRQTPKARQRSCRSINRTADTRIFFSWVKRYRVISRTLDSNDSPRLMSLKPIPAFSSAWSTPTCTLVSCAASI